MSSIQLVCGVTYQEDLAGVEPSELMDRILG